MEEARVEPAPSRRRKLSERLARSRHVFSERLSNSRHAIAEQVTTSSNAVSQRISTRAQTIKTKVKTKMSNLTPRPIRALFFLVRWLKRLVVFVFKSLKVLLKTLWILLLFYLLCMVLLAIPFVQTHAIFLHAITLPPYADFNVPEKYGLAPNRTFNFHIRTSDHQSLGAWFILSESYYHSLPSTVLHNNNRLERIHDALSKRPVILYLHGSGPSRAFSQRVQQYQAFSTRLNANVLAIDYRGFADSTGGQGPSEAGLVVDAVGALDWLVANGKKAEQVLVVGHGLGASVAAELGQRLSRDGKKCRGIVLLAPFSSMYQAVLSFKLFGFIPVMEPFSWIRGDYGHKIIKSVIKYPFDTLQTVSDNKAPKILIAHAADDSVISAVQSDTLFTACIKPYLPQSIFSLSQTGIERLTKTEESKDQDQPILFTEYLSSEKPERVSVEQRPLGRYIYPPSLPQQPHDEQGEGVSGNRNDNQGIAKYTNTTHIPNFGLISTFESDPDDGEDYSGRRTFLLVKTFAGDHESVGLQEGLLDIIGKTFAIERAGTVDLSTIDLAIGSPLTKVC